MKKASKSKARGPMSKTAAPTPSGVKRIVQRESVQGAKLHGGQSGKAIGK